MTADRSAPGDLTDHRVPGRVAVGTITRIGVAVRQEVPVGRNRTLATWGCAALAVAGVALSPVVGGVSLLAKAVLTVAVAVVAVFALHRWVPKPGAVDVHPFWVKDVTGTEHPCRASGAVPHGLLVEGTGVQVYGRVDKTGSVLVRQLITDDGRVCRPRLPLRQRIARGAGLVKAALWFGAALTVAWLLVFAH